MGVEVCLEPRDVAIMHPCLAHNFVSRAAIIVFSVQKTREEVSERMSE